MIPFPLIWKTMCWKNRISLLPLASTQIRELSELEKICFSDPWSEESLSSVCENDRYAYFVAWDAQFEVICGYGGMYTVLDSAEITNIAVLPSYRRQGIATMLLKKLISSAGERGAEVLHLEVRESNAGARALYEKLGFVTDGKRKAYYRHPTEAAVLMSLDIKNRESV